MTRGCHAFARAASDFDFTCDEEMCYFEVRVFDGDENLEVRGARGSAVRVVGVVARGTVYSHE